jgi:hypothetical protein
VLLLILQQAATKIALKRKDQYTSMAAKSFAIICVQKQIVVLIARKINASTAEIET